MQQIYCYWYTDTFTNGNIKLFVKICQCLCLWHRIHNYRLLIGSLDTVQEVGYVDTFLSISNPLSKWQIFYKKGKKLFFTFLFTFNLTKYGVSNIIEEQVCSKTKYGRKASAFINFSWNSSKQLTFIENLCNKRFM